MAIIYLQGKRFVEPEMQILALRANWRKSFSMHIVQFASVATSLDEKNKGTEGWTFPDKCLASPN